MFWNISNILTEIFATPWSMCLVTHWKWKWYLYTTPSPRSVSTYNLLLAVLLHFHDNYAGTWSWENIQLDKTKISNKISLELTLFHMRFVWPIIWCGATKNIIWSSLGALLLDFQKVYMDERKAGRKEGTQLYVNRLYTKRLLCHSCSKSRTCLNFWGNFHVWGCLLKL